MHEKSRYIVHKRGIETSRDIRQGVLERLFLLLDLPVSASKQASWKEINSCVFIVVCLLTYFYLILS